VDVADAVDDMHVVGNGVEGLGGQRGAPDLQQLAQGREARRVLTL